MDTLLDLFGGILGAYIASRICESPFWTRVKQAAMDASLKVPFNPPPKARK